MVQAINKDLQAKQEELAAGLKAFRRLRKQAHNLLNNIDDAKFMRDDNAVFSVNSQQIIDTAVSFQKLQQEGKAAYNRMNALKDEIKQLAEGDAPPTHGKEGKTNG